MAVVNLKRSEAEKKGMSLLAAPDESKDDYFYGLTITLEGPELDKIGLTEPKVGMRYPIEGVVKVVSYSDRDTGKSVQLQITDMGLKESPGEQQDRAQRMYSMMKGMSNGESG